MAQLGKLLRWLFGTNAIVFAAISLRYIWLSGSFATPWLRLLGYAALAIVFGATFYLLGEGGKRARYWALAASAINVPFYWIAQPAWMWTAAGILGLYVFSRQTTVEQMAAKSPKPLRLRGDGTSGSMDLIANVALFVGFLAAESYWAQWSLLEKLPPVSNLPMRLLLIEGAMLLTTLAHESGHAVAALFTKMKVRRFVVGPVEGSFRGGSWQLRFRPAGLLGAPGGVGVVPTTLEALRYRHVAVAAAGPIASLALGLLSMWTAIESKGQLWEPAWMLAAYTATFSLLAFLFNMIPMRPESVYSDGARIHQLLSRSPWADVYLALSMGSCTNASPLRPRDCDLHVLNRATAFLTHGMEALLLRVQLQTCYHDRTMLPEAITALEDAEAVYNDASPTLRPDLHKSFVFGNAFLKRDAAQARLWWNRMEVAGSAEHDTEYWFSLSALHWIEGDSVHAETAWQKSAALIELPGTGAQEYERDCVTQLRITMDTKMDTNMATKSPEVPNGHRDLEYSK